MSTVPELKARIAAKQRELRDLRKELRAVRGVEPPKRIAIRKRPKGGTWKADRDECDLLMARVVKVDRGGKCEACGETRRLRLQWAHGVSRRFLSTRWDWDNSRLLCAACHLRFTRNQPAWDAWMAEKIGADEYAKLQRRSQLPTHFDARILIGVRARARELGVDTSEGWAAWQAAA